MPAYQLKQVVVDAELFDPAKEQAGVKSFHSAMREGGKSYYLDGPAVAEYIAKGDWIVRYPDGRMQAVGPVEFAMWFQPMPAEAGDIGSGI